MNNDELKVVVGAQIHTKEAQETLKNFIKTSSETKIVLNTEVDTDGIERISKVYRTLNKYIDENGNLLETATHRRQLSNGALSAENGIITRLVEGYKDLSKQKEKQAEAEKKQADAIEAKNKKLRESTILYEENIRVRDKYGNIVSQTSKRNLNGDTEITRVYEYEDEKGRKVQATTKFLEKQNGEWILLGSTSIKVIDDQIKKEQEIENELKKVQKEQEAFNQKLRDTVKLRESHTYRNSKGENITIDTITNGADEKIRTITKEYETFEGTVRVVTQQVKELGKAWSKEEEISREVISNEISDAQKLGNKLEEVNRWRTGKGTELTRTHIIDALDVESVKDVEKYIDNLGNSVEKTTLKVKDSEGHWHTVSESVKKFKDDIAEAEQKEKELAEAQKKLNAELEKRIVSITNYKGKEKEVLDLRDKTIHKLQTEVKETTNANGIITKVTKTTDKFVDSQGMLNTKTTETTEKLRQTETGFEKVGDAITKTTTDIEKSKTGLNQLGQSFSDIIVKVAKFYLASLPIRAVQKAITETIQAVKDFDSALTEFKKVSDLSGESLDIYTEKLEKLGKLTARTRTEMVEMATEFKRSSYSDEESAELAQIASLYQNIADEELSASDAASVLISQMKAFQKQGIEAEHVIDSINEVANRNAVSSGDIGRGLTQAGAALSTYGNTFEQTIGLVTAGTEIFQGRSQQVARGLNTIASRVAKNEKALKEYGVEIYERNGDLKSTYDILKELSSEWDKMTKAEQVSLGTTLAGVNQYKVFSAVMTNFNTAVKASGEALNSQGSAMKENEKYMESIKARTQAVKNELQEMILKSDLDKLIKTFLSLAETILKVQNAIGGLKPLLVAISGILITFNIDKMIVGIGKIITLLKSDVFTKFLTSMVDFDLALKSLIKGEGVYIKETEAATVATEGYGLALSSLQTIIGMITIAITLLVVAVNAYNSAQEERSRKAHEFVEEEQEQINKINELINKIDTEKLSRESLNEIISENLKKYEEEISKIDDVNEARKRTIELLEKEKETEAKKIIASASATYEKESKKLENFSFGSKFKFGFNSTERAARKASERYKEYVNPDGTTEDFINYITEQRNKLKESSSDVNAYLTIFGFSNKEEAQETFNYIINQYEELTESVNNFENSLKRLGYVYENNQLISIEDTLNKGSDYYGKGNAESIFKEIQQAKEEYKLTDEEALIVKENLKKYGYDVKETIEQLQLGTVKQSKEAEDELAGFVEVFGLTEQQQADIIANLANNDFDIGATIESLGISTEVLDSWNEFAEETEEANKFLEETGLKENALQKQIGMSSTELVRQANEWGVNTKYLYDYLTALNKFDESLDNVQSNYSTLKSAVDEYNESGGFSIDTLQQLLKLSPEYLQTIFDENGELRLQNGILELNEQAIKDKVSAMAAEAKQDIYNNAVKRINNLSTDENVRKMIESKEAFDDTTNAIKKNSDSLVENAEATYLNAVSKARLSGKTTKNQLINQIMKETEEQISLIDNMVEKLGKDFSGTMNLNTKSTNETNSALKEQNQLLKQQKQELQDKKKQYEDVIGYIKKKIQDEIKKIEEEKKKQIESIKEQIDAIKELKDAELDSIQEQIDKLKEKQDEEEEYWQKKIDALKEQNDELNTQLEYEQLLQDLAKAKAKRVRVYEEGKGFVYKEDTNEIDKAQSKLDEFNRKQSYEKQLKQLEEYKKKSKENYDKQIKDLEKLKDEKEKNYDKQIKDLEDYQKKVEADYDARIKYFQDYLDKFTAETDAYENEVNRQLAIQLTGIDFEQQGWQTRLDNLANFVEKYNALLGDIHTLDGIEDTTTETKDPPEKEKGDGEKTRGKEISKEIKKNIENERKKIEESKNKAKVKKKASGDSYISEDGVYLVGDSPNQELVIGSRINGSLMNLTQGSGVVNSTSTRTLAGILNQLGVIGNQGVNMSNSHNNSTNISIGNISLPSVQNGKDFVDYLQNFSLQMTQEAFA